MTTHYADIVTRLYPGATLDSAERLTGGVSADVHRLDVQLANGATKSVVLRAHGASHSGHSAEFEYQLLKALHRAGVPVPEPLTVDVSGECLPDPFLIMTFVEGTTTIPANHADRYIDTMASVLAKIHETPTPDLPTLPARCDPLPEVFDFLPEDREWSSLREHLRSLTNTAYADLPRLLHGDFWPENLLWRNDAVAAILDWEDAALGDPLSDVAACGVELRYKFGNEGMQRFTEAYARHNPIDPKRLAVWRVYVAAAAQKFMSAWGLPAKREAHMRNVCLASIREAGAELMR